MGRPPFPVPGLLKILAMSDSPETESSEVSLAELLGGIPGDLGSQILTLYVPDRDREGKTVTGHADWVERFLEVLAKIGGGATAIRSIGIWRNPETGQLVRENTARIFTYIRADDFLKHAPALRNLLHRFGRDTRQGEVVIEFESEGSARLIRIRDYDPS